jgi:hypothetical protein
MQLLLRTSIYNIWPLLTTWGRNGYGGGIQQLKGIRYSLSIGLKKVGSYFI